MSYHVLCSSVQGTLFVRLDHALQQHHTWAGKSPDSRLGPWHLVWLIHDCSFWGRIHGSSIPFLDSDTFRRLSSKTSCKPSESNFDSSNDRNHCTSFFQFWLLSLGCRLLWPSSCSTHCLHVFRTHCRFWNNWLLYGFESKNPSRGSHGKLWVASLSALLSQSI